MNGIILNFIDLFCPCDLKYICVTHECVCVYDKDMHSQKKSPFLPQIILPNDHLSFL